MERWGATEMASGSDPHSGSVPDVSRCYPGGAEISHPAQHGVGSCWNVVSETGTALPCPTAAADNSPENPAYTLQQDPHPCGDQDGMPHPAA
ncbi:hypothetical protein PIB30_001428 [Stylosanthes scabra]|uniref:Uncharacterized protein n=1 Tax=Stylosanthes scabra TaxID=79078 RepID=A0ABU6Z1F7_9FABA|nr:hypothetical protein [Stylosanthes scabra]